MPHTCPLPCVCTQPLTVTHRLIRLHQVLRTNLGLAEKRSYAFRHAGSAELLVKRFGHLQALLGVVDDALRLGEFVIHRGVAARLVGKSLELEVLAVPIADFLRHFRCYNSVSPVI